MKPCYLFVHFKERSTPDGEQVYFSISRNGLQWEAVNQGAPVLWAYYGTRGVRDFTIVRHPVTGRFYIIATDLSIAYGVRVYRQDFWQHVGTQGSTSFSIWESEDLVHWTEQRLQNVQGERLKLGCAWAPDALWVPEKEAFLLHWSSSVHTDRYTKKRILCSCTSDFHSFSEPEILYEEEHEIIDSAMYEENGRYYLFYKGGDPCRIRLVVGDTPRGPFRRVPGFDRSMDAVEDGLYEAPTATKLADGRWALFIDYYGAHGADQGYVPFLSADLASGSFLRADQAFSFPYHFKHGTILQITDAEFERIQNHDWTDPGFVRFFS